MGGAGGSVSFRGASPPPPSSSPFPTIASSRPCHPDVRRDGGRGYYLRWRGIPYPLSLLPPLPVRPSAAIPNDGPRGGGSGYRRPFVRPSDLFLVAFSSIPPASSSPVFRYPPLHFPREFGSPHRTLDYVGHSFSLERTEDQIMTPWT
jgi:hypothetical protein